MPQEPSSARRSRRRVSILATGIELGLDGAPILRQLDRNLDVAGLAGTDEPEADRLLDFGAGKRSPEDLLAGGVALDDPQAALREIAVSLGGVAQGHDRHRLARLVAADRRGGNLEVGLGALGRDADQD